MSNDQMIRDLGRKISDQLETVLQRELKIAQIVLEPVDLSVMLLKIASGVSIASVMVVVQLGKDEIERERLFDIALEQLHGFNHDAKSRGMTLLAAAEARRGQ